MSDRLRHWVIVAVLFASGLCLVADATSSVYLPMHPERGCDSPACYTALEVLAGVCAPSPIRPAELALAFLCVGAVSVRIWRRARE